METARRICEIVKVSQLYQYLTGVPPKRVRGEMFRAPATWRSGDNPSAVSLDDSRGIWHDFVTDQGGGILDFVITVKGGTRKDALGIVAEFAGISLISESQPSEDHERWLEHKRILDAELQIARYWKRAAIKITAELLIELKRPLEDPTLPFPEFSSIYDATQFLHRLESLDGLDLIAEYHSFLESNPGLTAALVRWSRMREQQERRAVLGYLGLR